MNLLNGLAVSDIRKIQDDAEMLSIQTRVEQICSAESIVLYDYWGQGKIFRWLFGIIMGNKGLLLFPDPSLQKIKVVEPNDSKGFDRSHLVFELLFRASRCWKSTGVS